MPWVVGIDEAGYGPNLGPLVVGSSAVIVPEGGACVWETCGSVIRKASRRQLRGGIVVDDSKKVYAAGNGWADLEHSVLSLLTASGSWPGRGTFGHLMGCHVSEPARRDLAEEPWYHPEEDVSAGTGEVHGMGDRLRIAAEPSGVSWGPTHAVVIPPARFNGILNSEGNKSAVTATAVCELLRKARELPGDGPMIVRVDKQGGRHFYGGFLQDVFPDGWVLPVAEGPELSRYRILNLCREIEVTFEPRGDGKHAVVAIASMMSKYLRELCMRQFNRFWAELVPGIRPTAGYPVDARRFFDEIRPAMRARGLADDAVWRRK